MQIDFKHLRYVALYFIPLQRHIHILHIYPKKIPVILAGIFFTTRKAMSLMPELKERTFKIYRMYIRDDDSENTLIASIEISHSSWFKNTYIIRNLFVSAEYRGKGYARRLLQATIDKYGHRTISLEVCPFGREPGLNMEQLKDFYRKFGFVNDEKYYNPDSNMMIRGSNNLKYFPKEK